MMWGIQNEVYQSDKFAQFGDDFKVDKETLIAFNKSLAELAQSEDESRYIVQAEIDGTDANETAAELRVFFLQLPGNGFGGAGSLLQESQAGEDDRGHAELRRALHTAAGAADRCGRLWGDGGSLPHLSDRRAGAAGIGYRHPPPAVCGLLWCAAKAGDGAVRAGNRDGSADLLCTGGRNDGSFA